MDSYILRIYRREGERIVGQLITVDSPLPQAFHSMSELGRLLQAQPLAQDSSPTPTTEPRK